MRPPPASSPTSSSFPYTGCLRSPTLPDVPTVAETVPGFDLAVWYGAFGPAGLPADIVKRLNAEINKALKDPEVVKKMEGMAVQVLDSSPEQFAVELARDADKYEKLVRELGIRIE